MMFEPVRAAASYLSITGRLDDLAALHHEFISQRLGQAGLRPLLDSPPCQARRANNGRNAILNEGSQIDRGYSQWRRKRLRRERLRLSKKP
jgi:hypothetical protein